MKVDRLKNEIDLDPTHKYKDLSLILDKKRVWWTEHEKQKWIEGVAIYGRRWTKVSTYVKTRSMRSCIKFLIGMNEDDIATLPEDV